MIVVVLEAGAVVVVVPVEVPNRELVPVANPLKLGKVTDEVGLFGLRKDKDDDDDMVGLASFKLLAKLTLPLNVDLVDDWLKLVDRDDCCGCAVGKLKPPNELEVLGAAGVKVVAVGTAAVLKLNPLLALLVLENKPPDDAALPAPPNVVEDPKPNPVDVVEGAEPNKDFWTPSDGWFDWIELERPPPPKGVVPKVKPLLLEDGVFNEKPPNDKVVDGAAVDVADCPKMLWLGGLAAAAGAAADVEVEEPNEKAGLGAAVELAPKLSPPVVGAAVVLVENKPPEDCGAAGCIRWSGPETKTWTKIDKVGAAAAGVVDENEVFPKLKPEETGADAWLGAEVEDKPKRFVPDVAGLTADEPKRPPDGAAVDEDAAVVAEFPKLNDELMPPALLDAGCWADDPNEKGAAVPAWPVVVLVVPNAGVDVNENENGLLLFDPNINFSSLKFFSAFETKNFF